MKKLAIFIFIFLAIFAVYFYSSKIKNKQLTIGIILPIQHAALDDIVFGFKSELTSLMGDVPVKFIVQNSLGDINLQRSIINKFINDNVDLLVPVATATTQMALQLAPSKQKILFLAAQIDKNKPNLMGIIDKIDINKQIKLINQVIPELKQLSIIYSSSDKVFADVEEFIIKTKQENIIIQKLMIQNLSELYTISKRIEKNSQAIIILKDNLVASGINALANEANRLKIPLITSDEGTIKNGGALALGVVEADIGRQGAQIAAQFLKKLPVQDPIQEANKFNLFINKQALEQQGIAYDLVLNAAGLMGLSIIGG